jgi:hypothetical protein
VQLGDDLPVGFARGMQAVHGVIARLSTRLGLGAGTRSRSRHPTRWERCRTRDRLCRCPQRGLFVPHHLLHGFDEVLHDVKAVGDLDRLRSPAGGPFGAVGPAIPADHLDLRRRLQPGREGVGLPVRKQVNDLVAFEIDQNRSIGLKV